MTRRRHVLSLPAAVLLVGAAFLGASPADAASAPISLLVPSSTAFSMLGHSCGGIQEQAFATGFGADGYPTGAVYLQTKCGGSGRGGGYHTTTYSAWAGTSWDFAGALRSSTKLTTAPAVSPSFTATDSHGDVVSNSLSAVNVAPANCSVGNTTYCTYRAYLVDAAPATPAAVTVSQVGDSLVTSWATPTAGGIPASTTVTATPTSGAALTASVTGGATSATISGVSSSTTYSVVVSSSNSGGTSAPSAPVLITTATASMVPGAPSAVNASWASSSSILVRWSAPSAGDSPIDDYQVSIATYDPNGPPTVFDAGMTTSFVAGGYDSVPDYQVQVRAHNGAGWGTWSTRVILGGL